MSVCCTAGFGRRGFFGSTRRGIFGKIHYSGFSLSCDGKHSELERKARDL